MNSTCKYNKYLKNDGMRAGISHQKPLNWWKLKAVWSKHEKVETFLGRSFKDLTENFPNSQESTHDGYLFSVKLSISRSETLVKADPILITSVVE